MVAVLLIGGDQTPKIPLTEVVGKVTVEFSQIETTGLNEGMTGCPIEIKSVRETAHCPGFGVKVYTVEAVLLIAGDQVPVIPLVDVVASGAKGVPVQTGAMALNDGMVLAVLTVIVNVAVVAH